MALIAKRLARLASGVALAASLVFGAGSAMAQEKKVRVQMAGAFPAVLNADESQSQFPSGDER